MKATAKNIGSYPIAQVPASMKADHKEIVGIAQFYGQDKDITEAIDNYVAALNMAASKAKLKRPAKHSRKAKYYTYPEVSKMGYTNLVSGDPNDYVQIQVPGFYATSKDIDKSNVSELKATEYPVSATLKIFEKVDNDPNKLKLLKVGEWPFWATPPASQKLVYRQSDESWQDVKDRRFKPKKKLKPKSKTAPKRTPEQKAKAAAQVKKMRTDGVGGKYAKLSRGEVLQIARNFNRSRGLAAIMIDGGIDHKKRLSPTPENLVRWMKEPGKFDLIGVDNYKENDPTANLKISKEIFWNRLGLGRKR